MGLESINLFFHSEEPFEEKLRMNYLFDYYNEHKYVYKMDLKYWIDIEMLDSYSASLRILLSNPTVPLIEALDRLLLFLFRLHKPTLKDMSTKQIYYTYNDMVRKALEKSFLERKIIFESMYGDYTAAIGTDEFYNRGNH